MKTPALLVACLAGTCLGQDLPALDARLSDYPYPFDVELHEFRAQGQTLEMAYMDVRPESPNGRSALLLHGKNFSGAYWERTAELLAGEGFRVIIPDQIGFGKSSKPVDFQYSFHQLATDTKGLLDELKLPSVTVIGHSMGGMLATRFALMYPDRSEKLVLVNPIGLEDWKTMVPYQSIDDAVAAELKKTPKSVKAYMRKAYFEGRWNDAWTPLLEIQAGWTQGGAKEQMATISALTADMIFTQPVVYEFPDLRVPTLLIVGDRDRTAIGIDRADPETAEKMGRYDRLGQQTAKAIPNSTYARLEGVGHLPQVEAFQPYAEALLKFMKR